MRKSAIKDIDLYSHFKLINFEWAKLYRIEGLLVDGSYDVISLDGEVRMNFKPEITIYI